MFKPLTHQQILEEIGKENEAAAALDSSTDFEGVCRHICNAGKIACAALEGKPFNVVRISGVVMIERQAVLFGMKATKLEDVVA